MLIVILRIYKRLKYRLSPEYKQLNELMAKIRKGEQLADSQVDTLKFLIDNEKKYAK